MRFRDNDFQMRKSILGKKPAHAIIRATRSFPDEDIIKYNKKMLKHAREVKEAKKQRKKKKKQSS